MTPASEHSPAINRSVAALPHPWGRAGWPAVLILLTSLTGQAAYEPSSAAGNQLPGWNRVPGTLQDVVAIFGAGLFLLAVLLVWARYFRKRPHSGSGHDRHHQRHHEERTSESESDDDEGGQRRHRRKRRRREHRSRNPTLAETGGLPPPRTQDHSQP